MIVTPPISVSANAVRWKQCTGVAQRTISSTAVSGRSRLNSSHWSGFSKNAFMPCVIALRVVSLPATASRMHEERELDVAHGLAVDVGLDQPGDDVVGRAAAALLGHVVGVTHQLGVGGHVVRLEVRVVGVHDRVGPVEQLLAVGLGHADQIGDGQQRQASSRCRRRSCRCPSAAAAATISRAATASFSSSVATALGVNSRDTILRSRVCSGASWLISSALVRSSCSAVSAVGQPHHDALAVGGPQVAVARDRLDVLVAADHPVAAVVEDRAPPARSTTPARSCAVRRTR